MRARREALAHAALAEGRALADAGRLDAAEPWLRRAWRLAPRDFLVRLALAGLLLRRGVAEAATLFETLADEQGAAETGHHIGREVWLGLAAARRQAGDAASAAAALGRALAGTIGVDAALTAFADTLAAAADAPGWCAIGADSRPLCHAREPGRVQWSLDGRRAPRPGALPSPARLARAGRLEVSLDGRALIGSPLDLAAMRRVEGVAMARAGGIEGWAWLPGDPDRAPALRIGPTRGRAITVVAAEPLAEALAERPLAHPRGFRLAPEQLAGFTGPVHVRGPDGRDLLGSPLDPGLESRAAAAAAAAVARRNPAAGTPRRAAARAPDFVPVAADLPVPLPARAARMGAAPVTVVIPLHRGLETSRACLDAVLATVPAGTRIVVVDDASPEPALAALADALARAGRVRLVRHRRNRGFPAAANAGLRLARGDAVLLNSDAVPAPHWLARLRDVAWSRPDIGTVTPFSNEASLLSYPDSARANPVPVDLARLGRLADAANRGQAIEIPTGVGFCLYIRRDCLAAVGLLRQDVFAQGYGEENDFCLRARHLGWRHAAAPGVFVAHVGGASFGAGRAALMARNAAMLERLHPGYAALIAAHHEADPLAPARRRLDMARWTDTGVPPGVRAVLLVSHDRGGGVERQVCARAAAITAAGQRPIMLRPVMAAGSGAYRGLCRVDDGSDAFPNLVFALPAETAALARFLRRARPVRAELHHLLGHDRAVLDVLRRLGLPWSHFVHDYAALCPRISLLGAGGQYCGEPDVAACAHCVADGGHGLEETISAAALRARSAADLAAAERVVVPSADVARRLRRHFPALHPMVEPWEKAPASIPAGLAALGAPRIAVIGAIGREKGYEVLLACARDAARRRLALEFVLVGHSIDDERLLATGRVFVTGEYDAAEAAALIAEQRAGLAFLPSVVPETWCFTLSEAWRAGLRVVAFDLGAQAERIRARGEGVLLPLGLPAAEVNTALLRATRAVGQGMFTDARGEAITNAALPASADPARFVRSD